MKKSHVLVTRVFATVCCMSMVVPAEATLMSRLGGDAAYDDMLDITWLTDAGLSWGSWQEQLDWIDSLNSVNHLGFNDWRLASMSVSAGVPTGTTTSVFNCAFSTEAQCKDNELGYMFYYNLGGMFGDNLTGNQIVDGVDLMDIDILYWSGTEFGSSVAWYFGFNDGLQDSDIKSQRDPFNGWAVRAGDVAAVPEPPMVWLLATGLLGLLGIKGRQRRR